MHALFRRSQHTLCLIACISLTAMFAHAQQTAASIRFDDSSKTFRIDGTGVSYVFGVNNRNELQPIYWGARLSASDTFPQPHAAPEVSAFDLSTSTTPQEFAGWGAGLFVEPALKITFPDGNRDLVLHYVSHHIDGGALTVRLKDIERDVFVDLRYEIDPTTGVLGRSAVIENQTKTALIIEQAAAATWTLPHGTDYTLDYLTGRWAGEDQLHQEKIIPGARVLESRRGSTGNQNDPWFAVERAHTGDQDAGEVWFGALAWSGSWRITVNGA